MGTLNGDIMKYRLLALDLDGTLFNSRLVVTERTKRAIAEAMRKGVLVTLATGRHYPFAKVVALQLNLGMPIITHDGAYIAHPANDEVIFVRRIPADIVLEVAKILIACNLRIMVLHESYSLTNRMITLKEMLVHMKEVAAIHYYLLQKYETYYLPDHLLLSYIHMYRVSPPKIFAMGEEAGLEAAKRMLAGKLAEEIRVTTSGYGLEILPRGISKGTGLRLLTSLFGISPEQVIAVGDNYNDLEMIRFAGLGVAMGNAPEEVKKAADYVTASNDEDGVAKVIARFILNYG